MVPRVDGLWAHHPSYLNVTLGLAKLSNLFIRHFSNLFRLNVKVLADWLILVLRVVDELEALLVSTSLLFVEKAAPCREIGTLFDVLQPNDELIIVFVKVYLVSILLDLFQLFFTADLIHEFLIVSIIALFIVFIFLVSSLFPAIFVR